MASLVEVKKNDKPYFQDALVLNSEKADIIQRYILLRMNPTSAGCVFHWILISSEVLPALEWEVASMKLMLCK